MKSYRFLLFYSLVVMGLTSCLKDPNIEDKKYGMRGVEDLDLVEFPRATATTAFLPGTKDTLVRLLRVRLQSQEPALQDIKIEIQRNDQLVLDADPDLDYELPPNDIFEIKDYVLVIPKDSMEGFLQIKANPEDVKDHNYALGFSIKSVSSPNTSISRYSTDLITVLQIRNRYDGRYRVTGTMVDVQAPNITGDFPVEVELHTMADNEVALYYPFAEDYLQPILNNGAHTAYGSFTPLFEFNAAGKVVSVTNAYGQGAGSNPRFAAIDPSGVNQWDAATRNISVKFNLYQPNLSTLKTRFDEVFTYLGPRD